MYSKNVNQTLLPKTTNDGNSILKEEMCKINGATQEIEEKEQEKMQYKDNHDY